jgi:cold shock CspA family protein
MFAQRGTVKWLNDAKGYGWHSRLQEGQAVQLT